ncbi:MAG TPA: ribosome-associated translation inhibitor RaiA [Streptosporangiaceae bacterium]
MEITFKGRQTDVPARFREYATTKLNRLVRLEKKAISVDVEVSVERNPRLASQKDRVELTIWSGGPAIRAEAAAEDRMAALDLALAKLDSRLRRALDRRKNHYGTGSSSIAAAAVTTAGPPGPDVAGPPGVPVPAARLASSDGAMPDGAAVRASAAAGEDVVPIPMEGDGPLVVRQKFHHAKPIPIDQALLEMELVGHDFYLFHDIDADMPSVVYRRHGYQYGVIRLVENANVHGATADGSQAAMTP